MQPPRKLLHKCDSIWQELFVSDYPTPTSIAQACAKARLSIAEMCRRSGTAPSTYHRWRNGETSPRLDTLIDWLEVIKRARKGKHRGTDP